MKNTSIGVRLGIGFGIVLFSFTVVSLFLINRMTFLSDRATMMYRHPLTVSNAVLRIDGDIVRIHRSMKDVVLAAGDVELHEAIQKVDTYEEHILKDFDLVSERFLGSPAMYADAKRAFEDWKPIRDEVISLVELDRREEAARITKGKGAQHVERLNRTMLALGEFAQSKATEFLSDTVTARESTLKLAYSLAIATMVVSVLFAVVLTRSITQPLSILMAAVSEADSGNLDISVRSPSNDELGRVAEAFTAMIGRLRRSYQDLEGRVEERTAELAAANRELETEIEERKRTDADLRLHAQALDEMLEGVHIIRPEEGGFIYTNRAFEQMLGYESDELLGKHVSTINAPTDRSPEETAEEIISGIDAYGEWEGEVENIRKDGSTITTHAKVSTFVHPMQGPLWITTQEDVTERKEAENRLSSALHEKETLLREIHHRVKNNMQIITSLLRLQSGKIDDERSAQMLMDGENRIRSMALVHEQLYQSDMLGEIDFGAYVGGLCDILLRSYQSGPGGIAIDINVRDVVFDIENAIPCGLIINELVSNALKYAFPDGRTGKVEIEVEQLDDEKVYLTVRDNGIGIPEDFDIENLDTLGLDLVRTIAEHQLDGSVTFDRIDGTAIRIQFDKLQYSERV